jgi:putative transposase
MRLLVVEPYVRLFLKTLYTYQRQGAFQLHGFVVMPEHVHLLITPAPEKTLERDVQLIKGGYSHEFGLHFGLSKEVWQRGFTDHRIRDAQDFEQHRIYSSESGETRTGGKSPQIQILFRVSGIQAGSLALSG